MLSTLSFYVVVKKPNYIYIYIYIYIIFYYNYIGRYLVTDRDRIDADRHWPREKYTQIEIQ